MVVGGGFAGIEVFGEMRSLASALLARYPQLTFDDTHFHLIEAMGRIMPEVSLPTSHWVLKNYAERGANVHLDTQLKDATGGVIQLSTGESLRVRPDRLDRGRHGLPDAPQHRPPDRRSAVASA